MKLSDLKRIQKYKHVSELSEIDMITKIGLYENVLIDTLDIRSLPLENASETVRYVYDEVSKDVKAFHRFLKTEGRIELLCIDCEKKYPFYTVGCYNPKLTGENKENKNTKQPLNIPIVNYDGNDDLNEAQQSFLKHVDYTLNDEYFRTDSWTNYYETAHDSLVENNQKDYYKFLATKCMNKLLYNASEVRKEYRCTMNHSHWCMIGFVLSKAIDDKPEELKEYERRKATNDNALMTPEEEEAKNLYEKLMYSIVMRKIAQYPSMADMQFLDSEKYRKILGKDYINYSMALGLYSCGVGAGAFVYLRRILENIVEEAHQQCVKDTGWDDDEYKKKGFNDRIEILEDYGKEIIPKELKSIKKKIYGVISKGVHELSEEECKQIFPDIKDAIDLFLDAKIAKTERERRIEEVNKRIQHVE